MEGYSDLYGGGDSGSCDKLTMFSIGPRNGQRHWICSAGRGLRRKVGRLLYVSLAAVSERNIGLCLLLLIKREKYADLAADKACL